MSRWKIHLRSMLIGALGFGVGIVVGTWLSGLIFSIRSLDNAGDLVTSAKLFIGLSLIMLITALGGAICGGFGGVSLSYGTRSREKLPWYTWRSAVSFAIAFPVMLLPITLLLSLFSYYDPAGSSPLDLMWPMTIIGLMFGGLSGAILGLLTVGRSAWRVFIAGAIGFGLGGFVGGQWLWYYLFGGPQYQEVTWVLFTAYAIFGALGGAGLGYIYSWLTLREEKPTKIARLSERFRRLSPAQKYATLAGIVLLLLILRGLWLISPFAAQAAPLESTLPANTTGVAWSDPLVLPPAGTTASQPVIAANAAGEVAVAWSQGDANTSAILFATMQPDTAGWATPQQVSSPAATATHPQLVQDTGGQAHLIWFENNTELLYGRCNNEGCSSPLTLSSLAESACGGQPLADGGAAIALDAADRLMVTWSTGSEELPFITWPAAENPTAEHVACLPTPGQTAQQPRLDGGESGNFSLVYVTGPQDSIFRRQYSGGQWDSTPTELGQGHSPELMVDATQQLHAAWCDHEGQLSYLAPDGKLQEMSFPACLNRPLLAQDIHGQIHLLWASNEVKNVLGTTVANDLIYEIVQHGSQWSQPVIAAQNGSLTQPSLSTGSDGHLHLVWSGELSGTETIAYTGQPIYECDDSTVSDIEQVMLSVMRQDKFRPPSDQVPYCQNLFSLMVYAPNPQPEFSNEPATENGGFDALADLAKTAQYEVVFATMWYDDSSGNQDNPGSVLARAVAQLYQNLKEHPAQYPRGLTVRLLLGNPPKPALTTVLEPQIRSLLADLEAAGIPEMRNEALGWNLEVANFGGSWPHSHTKLMVVDGKTAVAVGFNYQYTHLPLDHPSGKGKGRVDLGMKVTGPVAQQTLRAFDDLWQASNAVYCPALNTSTSALAMLACHTQPGNPVHVPEVLRYYIPDASAGGQSNAFSLHRTQAFRESDEAYYAALAAAKSSLDIMHINFSLETICGINVLIEACNYANRVEYMDALMKAIETNQPQVRILVSDIAVVGIENNAAIEAFEDELKARGLDHLVEIRYFDRDVHAKSALIDQKLVVIGSQNFHYSAWGDNALTEYNMATDDPVAIENYQELFTYFWDNATLREQPN